MAARCAAFQGAWLLLLCLSALTVAILKADQDSAAPAIMYKKLVQTGNSRVFDDDGQPVVSDEAICKCQSHLSTDFGATGACCNSEGDAAACQIPNDCEGCYQAFNQCCLDRGLQPSCIA
eukprot:jgi/Botrbrau1/10023/Bobra.0012s0110.1